MKIDQIKKLIKKSKHIIVYQAADCQWWGDGAALYPMYGMPRMTKDEILTVLDIPEDKKDDFFYTEMEEMVFNTNMFESISEPLINSSFIQLVINDNNYLLMNTTAGDLLMNPKYLKPFNEEYALYERTAKNGRPYAIARNGFKILGILLLARANDEIREEMQRLAFGIAGTAVEKEDCCGQLSFKD